MSKPSPYPNAKEMVDSANVLLRLYNIKGWGKVVAGDTRYQLKIPFFGERPRTFRSPHHLLREVKREVKRLAGG